MRLTALIKEQEELTKKLKISNDFQRLEMIGAADCAFDDRYIYCVFVVFLYEEFKERLPKRDLRPIEVKTTRVKIDFPYIPGFLSYREKKAYLKTYKKLEILPDVILFDGQGISHPRRFGLACHIGVLLNKPTIGCAKSRLVGEFKMPGKRRGSCSPLIYNGEMVGYVLRTQDNVAPLFVSPGQGIDFATAKEIVLKTATNYRLPEPLRYAHIISKSLRESKPRIGSRR